MTYSGTMGAAAGMLLAVFGTGAVADRAEYGTLLPAAFVDAYIFACQPVEYDFAGVRQDLNKAAQRVHDNLLLNDYGGSCRDFYFGEIVPRLDVAR